jgi:hypothetical protein
VREVSPTNPNLDVWTLYDDETMRTFTNGWREIVEDIIKNKFLPTMVFYEKVPPDQPATLPITL